MAYIYWHGLCSAWRWAAMYLDYNILSSDPVAGQHLGIFLIELGVGITVASTMLAIYQCFNAHQSGEMTENE